MDRAEAAVQRAEEAARLEGSQLAAARRGAGEPGRLEELAID